MPSRRSSRQKDFHSGTPGLGIHVDGALSDRLASVPAATGVYRFLDDAGQVLYIGKAVDLRRRVGQYFRRSASGQQPRMRAMAGAVRDLDWILAGSELEALLLEDSLIKRHLPPYNKRQKKHLLQVYLEVTDEIYPHLRTIEVVPSHPNGDRVFGPYSDSFYADALKTFTTERYGIRSCIGAVPGSSCISYDRGVCPGPCVQGISPEAYDYIIAVQNKSYKVQ